MTKKKNLFNNLFYKFSCQHYSELASKSLDTGLSARESFLLKLHHVLCLLCRRCKAQIERIENTCCSMAKENKLIPNSDSIKLSQECKDKIKQKIC